MSEILKLLSFKPNYEEIKDGAELLAIYSPLSASQGERNIPFHNSDEDFCNNLELPVLLSHKKHNSTFLSKEELLTNPELLLHPHAVALGADTFYAPRFSPFLIPIIDGINKEGKEISPSPFNTFLDFPNSILDKIDILIGKNFSELKPEEVKALDKAVLTLRHLINYAPVLARIARNPGIARDKACVENFKKLIDKMNHALDITFVLCKNAPKSSQNPELDSLIKKVLEFNPDFIDRSLGAVRELTNSYKVMNLQLSKPVYLSLPFEESHSPISRTISQEAPAKPNIVPTPAVSHQTTRDNTTKATTQTPKVAATPTVSTTDLSTSRMMATLEELIKIPANTITQALTTIRSKGEIPEVIKAIPHLNSITKDPERLIAGLEDLAKRNQVNISRLQWKYFKDIVNEIKGQSVSTSIGIK